MSLEDLYVALGIGVAAGPLALVLALGASALFGLRLGERLLVRIVQCASAVGLVGASTILALMLVRGDRFVPIDLGHWVALEQLGFHFHVKLVFDRLSVPFALLVFVLSGTVGAFARVYLHRQEGFQRFFLLYAIFLLGMVVSALAGTIETLFFGWELVGLSSALLVAFFHERPRPVRNGFRVWSTYRIADGAFLLAALLLHHMTGGGDFEMMIGAGSWPDGVAEVGGASVVGVGVLLLLAAMGKSGLVPFSGWLPRAMEGPTPSSAIFYGALSVHLGAYLLLRIAPLIESSWTLRILIVGVGAASALFGALAARVQTDVKSAYAFASLTQLGIIVVEIGCGLAYIPLVHIIGHALLRTLQLLRAPSALADHFRLEDALGEENAGAGRRAELVGRPVSMGLYAFLHGRGAFDRSLDRFVVEPVTGAFRWARAREGRFTDALAKRTHGGPDA